MSSHERGADALSSGYSLGREVQDHLGGLLRTAFTVRAAAPLPERLLALVAGFERALAEQGRTAEAIRAEMLAFVPNLRNFALSLTRSPDQADDLVQETLLRALRNLDRFQPGTNLDAWLFTILRNQFHTLWRKRRREVEDPDAKHASRLAVVPDQADKIAVAELWPALDRLPRSQREALVMVAIEGRSIQEAAGLLGVPEGTIKSRVHRARVALAAALDIADEEDFGVDRVTRAALG